MGLGTGRLDASRKVLAENGNCSSGTVLLVPLSPILIFGWGPVPALGVVGAGLAVLATQALMAAAKAGSSPASASSEVRSCAAESPMHFLEFSGAARHGGGKSGG